MFITVIEQAYLVEEGIIWYTFSIQPQLLCVLLTSCLSNQSGCGDSERLHSRFMQLELLHGFANDDMLSTPETATILGMMQIAIVLMAYSMLKLYRGGMDAVVLFLQVPIQLILLVTCIGVVLIDASMVQAVADASVEYLRKAQFSLAMAGATSHAKLRVKSYHPLIFDCYNIPLNNITVLGLMNDFTLTALLALVL